MKEHCRFGMSGGLLYEAKALLQFIKSSISFLHSLISLAFYIMILCSIYVFRNK